MPSTVRAHLLALAVTAGCGSESREAREVASPLSRTEFTDRVESFLEYDALRAGRSSQFRIHLTDLAEGTPVGGADVTLKFLPGVETRARAGSVAGIYLAELAPPSLGTFDLEFRIRTESLDETLRISGFTVAE